MLNIPFHVSSRRKFFLSWVFPLSSTFFSLLSLSARLNVLCLMSLVGGSGSRGAQHRQSLFRTRLCWFGFFWRREWTLVSGEAFISPFKNKYFLKIIRKFRKFFYNFFRTHFTHFAPQGSMLCSEFKKRGWLCNSQVKSLLGWIQLFNLINAKTISKKQKAQHEWEVILNKAISNWIGINLNFMLWVVRQSVAQKCLKQKK